MILFLLGLACWTLNPGDIPAKRGDQIPILVDQDQSDHIEINLYIRAGSAFDPIGQEGLAHSTAQILIKQLRNKINSDSSTQISVGVQREVVTFKLVLSNLSEAKFLISNLLSPPEVSVEELDVLNEETLNKLYERQVVSKVFSTWMFEGHPYGHPVEGRTGSLKALSPHDVHRFFLRRYVRSGSFIKISVPQYIDKSTVLDSLKGVEELLSPHLVNPQTPKVLPAQKKNALLILSDEQK